MQGFYNNFSACEVTRDDVRLGRVGYQTFAGLPMQDAAQHL